MAGLTADVQIIENGHAVRLRHNKHQKELHPIWLRERAKDKNVFDYFNNQRLYDPALIPLNLSVTSAEIKASDALNLEFSDGFKASISLSEIRQELGWEMDPEEIPIPTSWDTTLILEQEFNWDELDDPAVMKKMLKNFLTYGFCIMQGTPTERNSLMKLAGRFGYVRDTHWGKLFNVERKINATDSAYTDRALPSHTDNPYREPIPGLQFLHCLKNDVEGGFSTLVDGIAITEQLRRESPELADTLEQVNVKFRYDGPAAILVTWGPMVERDHRGIVYKLRLNPKLDYVEAKDKATLDKFYAARQRLCELSNDPKFQISFPFKPGLLLMMDNYRLLHGRTGFDGGSGTRHLQGCYTDHDGVTSLYRQLINDGKTVQVAREEVL